jgi:putative two-component system response regulator
MDRLRSKPLLLIADANPENISVLKEILVSDYNLSVTAEGEEVIRLASAADSPALILLGNLPHSTNTYEVCRKLKADRATREIPIIFLVEPTAEDTEARAFELGAADIITKPKKGKKAGQRSA